MERHPRHHLGFTGTRHALTNEQRWDLAEALRTFWRLGYHTLHHGDCVGADVTAHDLARDLGFRVVLHPPDEPRHRAFCQADEVRPRLNYLSRNRAIVRESDFLLAVSDTITERQRSGTWMTVRAARQAGIGRYILLPNGRALVERETQ